MVTCFGEQSGWHGGVKNLDAVRAVTKQWNIAHQVVVINRFCVSAHTFVSKGLAGTSQQLPTILTLAGHHSLKPSIRCDSMSIDFSECRRSPLDRLIRARGCTPPSHTKGCRL